MLVLYFITGAKRNVQTVISLSPVMQRIVGLGAQRKSQFCPTRQILGGSGLHGLIESFPFRTALRSDAKSDKPGATESF